MIRQSGPEVSGFVETDPDTDIIEQFLVKVIHGQIREYAVFAASCLLAKYEVGYLLAVPEFKISVLIPVKILALVTVSLAALRYIEIDYLLAVNVR